MALIQAARPASGGGGGGLTLTGFANDQFTQLTNFIAGSVSIALSQTPLSDEGVIVDYNGQRLLKDAAWQYNSGTNEVEILFADPYVTDYDSPPIFQITYAY